MLLPFPDRGIVTAARRRALYAAVAAVALLLTVALAAPASAAAPGFDRASAPATFAPGAKTPGAGVSVSATTAAGFTTVVARTTGTRVEVVGGDGGPRVRKVAPATNGIARVVLTGTYTTVTVRVPASATSQAGPWATGYVLLSGTPEYTARKVTRTSITLTWRTARGVTGVVLRRTSGTRPAQSRTAGSPVTVHGGRAVDSRLKPGTTVTYTLFAKAGGAWLPGLSLTAHTASATGGGWATGPGTVVVDSAEITVVVDSTGPR